VHALGAALCAAVLACGAQPGAEPDDGVPYTYAQHIQPILEARCVACHNQGGIGGFALVDFDDADLWGEYASQVVAEGAMPPFPPQQDGCAPVEDSRIMSQEERDMFLQWVADGRPAGDPDLPPEYEVALPASSVGAPTHRFALEVEYYAPVDVFEEYRCFAVDPELSEPTRFSGLHVDTEAPERFHQARVSIVPPERLDELDALEGSDGRPGWPCYYNSGIAGLEPAGGLLPGRPFEPFPDGAVVELEAGTRFIVDAYLHHYSYEPLDLSVVAWEDSDAGAAAPNMLQLSDDTFVIPAGVDSFAATVEAEVVFADVDLSARPPDAPPAVHAGPVWSVDVHMHQWGRSASVEVVHADASRDCLLQIPIWDEEWQGSYALAKPVQIVAGDRIEATCQWANRADDQPLVNGAQIMPGDLTWGLDELHEMCDVRLVLTPQ
jgi:hypothetical protein